MADYIFTMKGVTKVHPPDKKVVEDLYLSFRAVHVDRLHQ